MLNKYFHPKCVKLFSQLHVSLANQLDWDIINLSCSVDMRTSITPDPTASEVCKSLRFCPRQMC